MLKSCCCMRLRTAGIVIGSLGVCASILTAITVGNMLSEAPEIAKIYAQSLDDTAASVEIFSKYITIICSICIGAALINFLTSTLLIVGTIKKRHLMLIPWLVQGAIGIILSIIYYIFIFSVAIGFSRSYINLILPLIVVLFILLFQFYIYFAVYSLYKQIRNKHENSPFESSSGSVCAKVRCINDSE